MIQVYKIPVPKEKLQAMPEDQRVSFLLLGYAANQLNFYTKIASFARIGIATMKQSKNCHQHKRKWLYASSLARYTKPTT